MTELEQHIAEGAVATVRHYLNDPDGPPAGWGYGNFCNKAIEVHVDAIARIANLLEAPMPELDLEAIDQYVTKNF